MIVVVLGVAQGIVRFTDVYLVRSHSQVCLINLTFKAERIRIGRFEVLNFLSC